MVGEKVSTQTESSLDHIITMVKSTLTVDGQTVTKLRDVRPTNVEYPETTEYPALHQRALSLKPLGDHIPPRGIREPVPVPRDRGLFADPDLPHLFANAAVKRLDLTPSLGTLITGLQLSSLTDTQKDELALLVAHRGVLFFREQDITAEGQRELFNYYGTLAYPSAPCCIF